MKTSSENICAHCQKFQIPIKNLYTPEKQETVLREEKDKKEDDKSNIPVEHVETLVDVGSLLDVIDKAAVDYLLVTIEDWAANDATEECTLDVVFANSEYDEEAWGNEDEKNSKILLCVTKYGWCW